MVFLRIFFTIVSALCVAAVFPVGYLLGMEWALCLVIAAILFFVVMLFFKAKQEKKESPTEERGDFLSPKGEDASTNSEKKGE